MHNTVENNGNWGIELTGAGVGSASANTLEARIAHNQACGNANVDIRAESGFSGNPFFPVPNAGSGNVLTGEIVQNTASIVTVQNGTPGNTATMSQFKNEPCP
jgi:hypothetical protein